MNCRILSSLSLTFVVILTLWFGTALSQDSKSIILITNVNVWDGLRENAIPAEILIENNLITEVGEEIAAPEGAKVIDGKGGTVIPGLIDMHSHIGLRDGLLQGVHDVDAYGMGALSYDNCRRYLDQGFTTARDVGSPTEAISKLIRSGDIPGPRIYTSGAWISQTSGHADVGGWNDHRKFEDAMELSEAVLIADGVSEVQKAVRRNLRKGRHTDKDDGWRRCVQ